MLTGINRQESKVRQNEYGYVIFKLSKTYLQTNAHFEKNALQRTDR